MIFFVLFFLTFFIITLQSIPLGLSILFVLLPSYLIRFKIGIFPTTLLEGMVVVVFLIFLWKNKNNLSKTIFKPFPYRWPVIFLLAASFLSIFFSPSWWKGLGLWRAYFLEPILIFFIFIHTVKTKKDLYMILGGLGGGALAVSLWGIYQKITGDFIPVEMWRPLEKRRITSFFTSPNAVGLYLAPLIMLYAGWAGETLALFKKNLYQLKQKKGAFLGWQLLLLWQILVLEMALLAVVFSRSRGTALGLAGAFLVFFLLIWRKKMKPLSSPWLKRILLFVAFFLMFLVSPSFFPNQRIAFQEKAKSLIFSPSVQNRFLLWQGSWQFLTQNPKNFLFGAGIFGFPQVQEKFRNPQEMEPLIYPHNIFLNFWMEIGLVGMFSVIWLIIISFKNTVLLLYKNNNFYLLLGTASAMVAITIHGLIDVPYFKNDLAILFWIIIGLNVIFSSMPIKKP